MRSRIWAAGKLPALLALVAASSSCDKETVAVSPPPAVDLSTEVRVSGVPATRRAQEDGGAFAVPSIIGRARESARPAPQPAADRAPSGPLQADRQRPVFREDIQAIGDKVVQAWSGPAEGAPPPDAVIQVRVAVGVDGTVLAVRTVDEARVKSDAAYRQWSESLEDAIVRASPLPIPAERADQFRLMILPFNPRLTFGASPRPAGGPPAAAPAAAAEVGRVQAHVAEYWFPPRLPPGARGQDFAVAVRIELEDDGRVRLARALDQTRVLQDPLYRLLAQSAERAIRQASPLPVSAGTGRGRVLMLNFVADDE